MLRRAVVVITFVVALFGLGAGMQANAAPTPSVEVPAANHGCIIIPALLKVVCLETF